MKMSELKITRGSGEIDPKRVELAESAARENAPKLARGTLKLGETLKAARGGSYTAMAELKESVSTSDFPFLFNQLVDYGIINAYSRLPSVWQTFAARTTVTDFRPQRMRQWYEDLSQLPEQGGGETRVPQALPRVPELTEYPTFTLAAEETSYGIAKYGKRFPFSWEVFINDELQVIMDLPGTMASTANDTEDILALRTLAGPNGFNSSFINTEWDFGELVPSGNILQDNPPLTVSALEQAFANVSQRRVNGRIVTVNSWTLMVPPSLEATAQRIASVMDYTEIVEEDGVTREYTYPNPVRGRFSIVVNPWIPVVDTSDSMATSWYLLPSGGSDGVNRAIVVPFLAGEEVPDVRISSDTGRPVGGGDMDPYRGSFTHDDIQFRVRHILGAQGLNPAPVVASRGDETPTHS